ncbi:UNVERIFIED_CONTAM: hypothetical protein GTU68_002360 [Idotea baltica]|nr:hypothetical protein [Idotea baltica]
MKDVVVERVQELLSNYLLVDVVPIIVDLDKSYGNRLVDARDGREWLDCFSYIASNAIGFNHPKMFDTAFETQLLRAARAKPANSDFYTEDMARFVSTFVRVAVPKELQHLFFIEGGALAVENGMKTAFDWKVRKNLARGAKREIGSKILHFQQAFHGRSGYTLSVTNTADPRKIKYFPKFDWPRVPNPKVSFPLTPANLSAVEEAERVSIKAIEEAFDQNPDDIAAILIEPIQGEGGDNHFRNEFHQNLRRIADEREALLIYDEVQTGLGLTGKMWAYEHYGITPDIVCFGKKMQVCGCMVGNRIDEVKDNVFEEPSRINSTWGGNLTDMVRAGRILEIIEEDSLVQNAADVGAYFFEQLQGLIDGHPDTLSNVRGKGLFLAFDLRSTEQRDLFFKECFLNGLLVLKASLNTIRLRPSLTFSKQEVDEAMQIFAKVADRVK